jgi:hypothetical protein
MSAEGILTIIIGLGLGVWFHTQTAGCLDRQAAKIEKERIEFPITCQKHCKSLNAKASVNTESTPQQCFCVLP